MVRVLCLLCALLSGIGCLPRTTVHKNPGPLDHGVRYYRPKPYLFLKQAVDKNGNERAGFVSLELQWLPDFAEEYSIHVHPGLGMNQTKIMLQDGWNLTSLDVDIDSQFDENVEAIAELVSQAGALGGGQRSAAGAPSLTVEATNVPLGLYEAVITKGLDGKKRLYGFRYVGFFPFAACPVDSCGQDCIPCEQAEIYGLVYERGAMVFRPLGTLPDQVLIRDREREARREGSVPPDGERGSDDEQALRWIESDELPVR